jgi:hypothetical protein
MGALIGWLYRSALKRGAKGGHWAWYVVALGAFLLRRDRERRTRPVVGFSVKPGETVQVTARELDRS